MGSLTPALEAPWGFSEHHITPVSKGQWLAQSRPGWRVADPTRLSLVGTDTVWDTVSGGWGREGQRPRRGPTLM